MNISDLYKKEEQYYNKYTDNLFSGQVDEGKEIGQIKDGFKEGFWKKILDEEGKEVLKGEYVKGKYHNEWIYLYDNKSRIISVFEYGNLKEKKSFDNNNNLKSVSSYKDKDNYSTQWFKSNEDHETLLEKIEYVENGKIKTEKNFKFGELQTIYHWTDDMCYLIEHYENGKLINKEKTEKHISDNFFK